ncbi:MAG: ACP S-malonyltransferase [Bdellovibrionales bacterium]
MKWSAVFPGQGSQAVGMGRWLVQNFPIAQRTFHEASEALGFDLQKLCFESSDAELALTQNTQPALLCVSTATQRVLRETLSPTLSLTAGHSIGEYAALVLADVIDFPTAMKAVRLRGEAMQAAVPVGLGGMVAVLGLQDEQITALCQWAEKASGQGPVQAANFNCPGQVVLSGNLQALNYLRENFKPEVVPGEAKRVKFIPLNVSAPFHCSLMKPAEEKMAQFLKPVSFHKAQIPVVQNLTAEIVTDPSTLKSNLVAQVSGAVRWTQSVHTAVNSEVTHFIECGHGTVLKGLIKKCDERAQVHSLQTLEDLKILEGALKASGH